ncbi:hypothetical protein GCT13_24620 [Paraburkholderia sp. CNPSo 3157]|uniref:Uncharacterized protein n=1 Tax=Paraburkholderia franconis TaxID=2654983 RepID=A0A7X1TI24_9BURK|nr:hypothetical protein [Paraburkholderia franconis]
MPSTITLGLARWPSRFRLPAVVLLCSTGLLLLGVSIFGRDSFVLGRVPTAVLADADRQVAQYGPALVGSTCAIDGTVSRDSRGTFLMCWKHIRAKP